MIKYSVLFLVVLVLSIFSCSTDKRTNDKKNPNWVAFIEDNRRDTFFVEASKARRFIFDNEFSGKTIEYYSSGKEKYLKSYSGAFPNGTSVLFYENGKEKFKRSIDRRTGKGNCFYGYDNGQLCCEFRVIDEEINDTAVVFSYFGDSLHKVYMKGENVELLEEYKLPTDFEYKKHMECLE